MTFHAALYDGRLGYTATDDRQAAESWANGQGVLDVGALRCAAGSGLNTSMGAGKALIRNTHISQGGLWIVRNDASVSVAHAAGGGNPRIDTVGVRQYDSETGGDQSDVTQPFIVPGTATPGASISNRAGAGIWPASFMPCSDVLVPAGAGSSSLFTYYDRRPSAIQELVTAGASSLGIDYVQPRMLLPVKLVDAQIGDNATAYAVGMSFWLSRSTPASYVRWQYLQGSTTNANFYWWAFYEPGGHMITSTNGIAFTGSASTEQIRADPLNTPVTLDAGRYIAYFGMEDTGAAVMIGHPCYDVVDGKFDGLLYYNYVSNPVPPAYLLDKLTDDLSSGSPPVHKAPLSTARMPRFVLSAT